MPGMDYEGVAITIESPVLGSLKTHRAFPRKEPAPNESSGLPQVRPRRSSSDPLKVQNRTSHPTSDRLRSWMREPSETRAIPVIGQPLTPPINFRDNFKSWIDDKALRDREFLSQQKISPGNTPLVANSPPTPETTPPKQNHKSSKVDSFSATRNVSRGSTTTFQNQPESRTDSFKTAREDLSSDDEGHPPDSPSLHPSRQKWLRDMGLSRQKDVGLGLGLESEDDELPTPREKIAPKEVTKKGEEFVNFNGAWGSNTSQEVEDTESQITAQRDSDEVDQTKIKEIMEGTHMDSPTLGIEIRPIAKKEPKMPLKNGARRKSISEERKGLGERGQSLRLLKNGLCEMRDLGTKTPAVDDKRLSQASTTSTIVEAIVVESPPRRRQTLRHTGKMMRLDSLDSQQSHSNTTSRQSDEHSLKHQVRTARNPNQGLRKRYTSEISQSKAHKSALAKLEGSSVVVIPDRRSSLQSSANSSKCLSRTFSLNSKQQSSRPTTAPEESVGYFDMPRRERGTVSVVIQQAIPLKMEKKSERSVSPPTPSAISPATAAGRELSRTTSVTSGGFATHYIPETLTSHGTATPQTIEIHDNQIINIDRSNSGDWGALRPQSALVTPFSLRSAHSSTPGTFEVNEATAISIYPHTNKSILVIQEMAGRDESSQNQQSAVIAGNASIALPGTFAPVETQPAPPSLYREIIDSPLQNPRDQPQPPDFKIIPPTPANAASSSEDTVRNVRSSRRSNRFSAPFTSLRRAISARRHSESIANPFVFTRTLSLRDTSSRQRAGTTEANKDSQLHPFWRPRTFWDDANESDSDSDSEFGNNGTLSPRRPSSHGTTHRSSKPPMRTMSLTRRFTDSLRSTSTRRPVPRRASISLTSDIISKFAIDNAHVEIKPPNHSKRTLPLTRKRLGGSLGLPQTSISESHRPRRSTTADWHNQPNYEYIPTSNHHRDQPRNPTPTNEGAFSQNQEEAGGGHSSIGFRHLAERLERRRSAREEDKREERRNWLKGRIGFVGVKDVNVLSRFDIVYPPPPVPSNTNAAKRRSVTAAAPKQVWVAGD